MDGIFHFIGGLRNKVCFFATFSAFLMVIGSTSPGLADDTSADILERLEKIEQTAGENSLAQKLGISFYGYVSASYTQNFNNPNSQANALRIFDGDANSFRPNMAQLVVEKVGQSGGSMKERAGFRVKLDFGEDAKFTGGNTGADEVDFQEAYAQYVAPIGNGLDLRIGRMNTLIGYEVIESPLNPNFSRSWLFGLGEPFTTTGIRGTYQVSESVTFSIGGINSFTGTQADLNRSKSVEALLGVTPTDWLSVSLFGFWGPEGALGTDNSDRVLGGAIIDIQATDQTEFVIEAYYANQANATPGTNARWNGVAGYVIHNFTDEWGIRIRGELFEDADGFLGCGGTVGSAGNANTCFDGIAPASQTLWEGTVTLQYKPVPSLLTRVEFRYDKSNRNTFQFGSRAANHQETLAAEVAYLF
ncbi:MAG: porin [Nitrospirales bacterium]|nr:porin [Nitrospira sp.]MDR4499832.1 porin [Nitrospirales bacterium]